MEATKIGFVGQGYIGGNLADNFEERGFETVRYSLEPDHIDNKSKIVECPVVFVAVPAPTTPEGVDTSILEESLECTGNGAIVVLKSTILPGTSKQLQDKYPERTILFSPEFLSKASARHDTDHPFCNIIGFSKDTDEHRQAAQKIMDILPKSQNNFIVPAETAELFKYMHNVHGFMRIVLSNLYYDIGAHLGADWDELKAMIEVDPMMSKYYNDPVHQDGRGAGGCCFIKDYAAFRDFYEKNLETDPLGISLLKTLEEKNLALLKETNKNQEYVEQVYGKDH